MIQTQRAQPLRRAVRRALALAAPGITTGPRRGACRLRLLAVLVGGLAAGAGVAQPPFQMEVIPGFSSLNVDIRSKPVLADLDGDGDLDLIAGEERGTLRFFENTGTASLGAFVERTGTANPFGLFDVGMRSKPTLADLDADFDFDALVGEEGGTLRYFENTGLATAPVFVERMGAGNPLVGVDVGTSSDPALADLDGDGDLDLLVGESGGRFSYFENIGSPAVPVFAQRSGSANPLDGVDLGSTTSLDFADLDADGDFDLVVGEFAGIVFYFANTGSSSTPALVQRGGTANPFNGIDVGLWSTPALGDLDADGDLDAVLGDSLGGLSLFRNAGATTAAAFVAASGTANPINGVDVGVNAQPSLADLDGDGDVDVLAGEGSGRLSYFENTGGSSAPGFVHRTGVLNPLDGLDVGADASPELADLDGDGDLDVAIGTVDGVVRFFANTGSSLVPAYFELTGALSAFDGVDVGDDSTPELADLDGDADLDAILGNLEGVVAFFENSGGSTAPLFVEVTGPGKPFAGVDLGANSHPELIDLDGDDDYDAIFGEAGGGLAYFHNTGTPTGPFFLERTGAANPFDGIDVGRYTAPQLADLDGDGDLDALVGESGGRLVFFRSQASLVPALPFADGFESGDVSAWALAVPPP